MGAQPASVDSNARDLINRLNEVRLTRDWSYRQLSEEIERVTGTLVSAQTLQPLLSGRYSKPYDRTLYKLRRYFDALAAEEPTKRSRKAKGRAA
jgi:transcriptional regulator with XRE-family HTH domain